MKSRLLCKLAAGCCFAATIAFATLTGGSVPAFADADDTPSDVGTSETNPIEVPDDGGSAGEVTNGSNDSESSFYWKYRYVHNNTGNGDPSNPDDPGTSANWVSLKVKQPKKVDDEGDAIDEKDHTEHRIVIGGVKKKDSQGNWENAGSTEPADGKGKKVRIVLDEPWAYCETLEIKMRVEHRKKKEGGSPGHPEWEWDDWESDTETSVKFNVVEMLDGDQNEIEKAESGDEPSGNSSGEPGQQGSMDYVFPLDPPPDFTPGQVGAYDTGTVEAPDLVFSEGASWAMPAGTLRFVATGGATFSAPPGGLQVIANDADGNNAEATGEITLGSPSIVTGEIHVPVVYRDDDAQFRVSIMVRGAIVNLPSSGYGGGTTIRYAVGGECTGGVPVRMPPLVRIGGEPEGEAYKTSAEVMIDIDDPQNPGTCPVEVGRFVHMARPYSSAAHEGFIDAIVLGESSAGTFREGDFEIKPVDGFNFVESDDTKLLVVHANDHSELVDAFDGGDIEITSGGAIRVTLGTRAIVESPVKLIILNPKLNLGPGPFVKFQNARAAVGGDALRAGLGQTLLLVEGMHGTEEDFDFLPQEAIEVSALTPLAEVETE